MCKWFMMHTRFIKQNKLDSRNFKIVLSTASILEKVSKTICYEADEDFAESC